MTSTTSPETWKTYRVWIPNTGPNFAGLASYLTHSSDACSEIRKGSKPVKGGAAALCSKCFGGKLVELSTSMGRYGRIEILPVATGFDGTLTGVEFAVCGDVPDVARGTKRFSDHDEARAFANEVFRLAAEAGWVRK